MKVVGFNGSPRKDGNTSIAIKTVFEVLEKEGLETEIINIARDPIGGCDACGICKKVKDGFCKIDSDIINYCLKKMYECEGIIIGSPVYFGSVTPQVKALIDRSGYCSRAGGYMLKRKVCAGVIAVRRQGAVETLHQINNLFLINQAIIPGSIYWNMGIGREKGDILKDGEGMDTFRNLEENMAWLIKKINS
ncbi:MAG: flavodoxin family protein [Actinobacteria bacterium]|nr:flavodoxin family protein [Actinomycetota bacterium]